MGEVACNCPRLLGSLGRRELKRCFNRSGDSAVAKPAPDIAVAHPVGRFGQANTDARWRDARFRTLMAHCNHGETCKGAFRGADHLATFTDDAVAELMQRFATAAPEEQLQQRLAPCPPRIAKARHLGVARRSLGAGRSLCSRLVPLLR